MQLERSPEARLGAWRPHCQSTVRAAAGEGTRDMRTPARRRSSAGCRRPACLPPTQQGSRQAGWARRLRKPTLHPWQQAGPASWGAHAGRLFRLGRRQARFELARRPGPRRPCRRRPRWRCARARPCDRGPRLGAWRRPGGAAGADGAGVRGVRAVEAVQRRAGEHGRRRQRARPAGGAERRRARARAAPLRGAPAAARRARAPPPRPPRARRPARPPTARRAPRTTSAWARAPPRRPGQGREPAQAASPGRAARRRRAAAPAPAARARAVPARGRARRWAAAAAPAAPRPPARRSAAGAAAGARGASVSGRARASPGRAPPCLCLRAHRRGAWMHVPSRLHAAASAAPHVTLPRQRARGEERKGVQSDAAAGGIATGAVCGGCACRDAACCGVRGRLRESTSTRPRCDRCRAPRGAAGGPTIGRSGRFGRAIQEAQRRIRAATLQVRRRQRRRRPWRQLALRRDLVPRPRPRAQGGARGRGRRDERVPLRRGRRHARARALGHHPDRALPHRRVHGRRRALRQQRHRGLLARGLPGPAVGGRRGAERGHAEAARLDAVLRHQRHLRAWQRAWATVGQPGPT